MIGNDKERSEKIAIMQRFVDEGLASGVGSKSKEALFEEARIRLGTEKRS